MLVRPRRERQRARQASSCRSPRMADGVILRQLDLPRRRRPAMKGSVDVPTIAVLNDLVARCSEINRYATQLTAAEEARVAALAAALVTMRQVLGLERVGTMELPVRHARVAHWALTGASVVEVETDAIRQLPGMLVLDDHG